MKQCEKSSIETNCFSINEKSNFKNEQKVKNKILTLLMYYTTNYKIPFNVYGTDLLKFHNIPEIP